MFLMKNDSFLMSINKDSGISFNTNMNYFSNRPKGLNKTMDQNSTRVNSAAPFETMVQSPNLKSMKIRNLKTGFQEKIYSILDINEKNVSRGSSFPYQFESQLEKSIIKDEKITGTQNKLSFSKCNKLERKIEFKNNFIKVNHKKNLSRNIKNHTNNNLNKFDTQRQQVINSIPKSCTFSDVQYDMSKIEKFYHRQPMKNDKCLPTSFRENERLTKTSQSQRKQEEDPFAKKLVFLPLKEIKYKMLDSDIFYNKIKKKEVEIELRRCSNDVKNKKDYLESDIFMLNNNETSLQKNGEVKYLDDKGNIKIKSTYNVSNKSNSEWQPKNSLPSLLNHTSSEQHILNQNMKNIFKTREKIIEEAKANRFNPKHRQKSLCEFIDLNNVGVQNSNKEYTSAFKKDNSIFAIKPNICSNFLEIHMQYKGICDQPFVKKIV